MEDMKDANNIFEVLTKPRREVDIDGKLRNGLYLIYYIVVNKNPVEVTTLLCQKMV